MNEGTIIGAHYALNPNTFWEVAFGAQAALEIDNETYGDNALAFTNSGTLLTTVHAASGVTIEVEAGDDDPDEGEVALIGNVSVDVVNSGTISATGGATLVPQQFATWLEPGQLLVNPMAALAVDATDVNGESVITVDNQEGGVIRAGGALQVVTPNAYVPAANAPADLYTVAVYAAGKTIEITNSGRIEGGRGSTLQPNMVMEDFEFHETFLAGAIQTAGAEYENADGDEVYVASVDRVTNTASGVIVGSINLGGNDDVLHNAGRIEGAVHLGTGDDVLELGESSIIEDVVDLGDGDDQVVLAFGEGVTTGTGQVATTVNAERLMAQSGNWRAEGEQSEYGSVSIAQGATLTVVENEDGELAIATGAVELAGALRLDLSVDETEGDLGDTTIAGAGSLHLIGTARVDLTDATGLQHTGGTFVENGELLLETVYGGDITTTGEGVFELGANGDFTGNLVNDGTFVFSRDSDYGFLGDFSGSGALVKDGDSRLTFAGLYAFEGTTSVLGGSVAFTGQLSDDTELDLTEGTVDLSQVEGGEQNHRRASGHRGHATARADAVGHPTDGQHRVLGPDPGPRHARQGRRR